jgi:hypothetical protein
MTISFYREIIFYAKLLYFEIEHFVEKLSKFISFSYSFRIRSCPDPELFFPDPDPCTDPDPQHCY